MNKERIYKLREIKDILKPIPLHNNVLSKYALILTYYPIKETKLQIYLKLDKNQRLGMLNRYILSVASKIGIYQVLLKNIITLRNKYSRLLVYINENQEVSPNKKDEYWKKSLESTQIELAKQYNILLDVIIEELNKRENPKYLRKKKLDEIKQNLQN